MNSSEKSVSMGSDTSETFGGRARSGTQWLMAGFAIGQIARLLANIALAAILFEEVFALMAIVSAVMFGLAMFSDIGLKANVVQHPRGDDPDFLNTAWTLQVMRGVCLFLMAVAMAWPLSRIYGANDPKAYELLYLIPMVALTSLITGFESTKLLTAARHLKVKEVTQLEFIVGGFGTVMMLVLAWYMRSVYALAIASVLSSVLQTYLSYKMLDGQPSRFRWEPESVKAIFSFGKWVFLSTFFTFAALQIDRFTMGAVFPLAQVGVYSIAASLAFIVPTVVGRLQWSVLFPWYSRMLERGMPLSEAFGRTRMAMMVFSSFFCALLIGGAHSFFELAYDDRYAMGGVLLPLLALGAWFSCLEPMYGATFVASGRPKWTAIANASKVAAFGLLFVLLTFFELDIVVAALFLSLSEVVRWLVCHGLGRRLGLRNARSELGMLLLFLAVSFAGWWLVERAPLVSELGAFWRLVVLGVAVTALFLPLFFRFGMPLLRQK